MSIPAYPLQWPGGWPRSKGRKAGQFGKQKTEYGAANQRRLYGGQ